MAYCPAQKSYGYESCRFEKDVDENFHCSICYNVLKEPRTCRNNDHIFCLACITDYLRVNRQTCPECNDYLSVDTLRRPRVVNNYLSELNIKCDYASRGCSEFVRVADLETHVEKCGFAPVICSNCGVEINKLEKIHHETEACEYRQVKCRDCGQIQEVVGKLEENVSELGKKVETAEAETRRKVEVVNKEVIKEVTDIKEKLETTRREMKNEVKKVKKEVNDAKEKVEVARREIKNEVEEVKKGVKDFKENISKLNNDVDEVKVVMSQMLERLNMLNMLEQLNKLPSLTGRMMSTPREDILIAGGSGPSMNIEQSTEIYSWEKHGWFRMSEMNKRHEGASSFTHKNQLFVVGGDDSKTIETLDLNELHLKWMKFPGELPHACYDHQTVVYQQRIIHIGGCNYEEGEVFNVRAIYELQLATSCTMKELCQMPEPRECHGAEIFEDKILIMGGESDDGALDSVLEFDVKKNQCKAVPPLPHALKKMATVRWGDKVVVLGGVNEQQEVLNDVFMYDCETGKITTLPSMLEKRLRCCAVITGNTIVVMGGYDNRKDLKSVEYFTMGGYTWEYLPAMNEARWGAVAEILPSKRKYV